jgi:hypothetical protein
VQRKRTSSVAAKEKAANHSLLPCWPAATLHCSQKTDASESRFIYTLLQGALASRLSVFCFAARLREMALKKYFFAFLWTPFCSAEHRKS